MSDGAVKAGHRGGIVVTPTCPRCDVEVTVVTASTPRVTECSAIVACECGWTGQLLVRLLPLQ